MVGGLLACADSTPCHTKRQHIHSLGEHCSWPLADFYGEAREWLQSSGCLLEGGDAVDVPSLLARVSQRASGHPRGRKDGGEAGTIESGTKWGTADLSWYVTSSSFTAREPVFRTHTASDPVCSGCTSVL